YRVQVTSDGLAALSPAAIVTVNSPPPSRSRLLNLSTRAWCGTGNQVVIPGLVIRGTSPKRILVRAIGPSLGITPFNLAGVLPDPQTQLKKQYNGAVTDIASNLDWGMAANVSEM